MARSTRRPPALDAAIAAGLTAWAIAEAGDPAVGVPAALLMTLPLAWRRSAPLAVAALVAAGTALQAAQANPPESLATLVAILLAAFSIAAHASTMPRAELGLGLLLAGGLAETALAGDEDYAFITVLLAVAAAAGFALGARGREARLARERAEEAEAHRERDAAAAVQAERERIARDLHDSIAHAVSLMVVQAGVAETVADEDNKTRELLRRVQDTGREAVADLGRMVGLLRTGDAADAAPPMLGDGRRLVESFRDAGLPVKLELTGTPKALPAAIEVAAFRIAQEALTNALKHGAGDASLVIDYGADELHLNVTNAVAPARPRRSNGTGHGLIGMRERVRVFDGRFEAGARTDDRFVVEACLPLPVER